MALLYFDPAINRLAEALGLDPSKTSKFTLVVNPDHLVHVVAEIMPSEEQVQKLAEIIDSLEEKPIVVDQDGFRVFPKK